MCENLENQRNQFVQKTFFLNLIRDIYYDKIRVQCDNLFISNAIFKLENKSIKLGKLASARSNTMYIRHINNIQINSNNKNKSESEENKFKLPDEIWNNIVNKEKQWIFNHRINERKSYVLQCLDR